MGMIDGACWTPPEMPLVKVLTKPGGSLAGPRVTFSDGEEIGPRAVVVT